MNINLSEFEIYGSILGLFFILVLIFAFRGVLAKLFPDASRNAYRNRSGILLGSLLLLIVMIVVLSRVIVVIPPGHVAVVWSRFGGGIKTHTHFNEGTMLISPWDEFINYSARYQVLPFEITAVTSEGLNIGIDIFVRYQIVVDDITLMHKLVGPNYTNRLVIPEISSWVRLVASKYTVEEIYFSKRQAIQAEILSLTRSGMSIDISGHNPHSEKAGSLTQFVNVQDILLKQVELPEKVKQAIIAKINKKYLYEEYDNRLIVERKEAERKKIEAEGISLFQQTIAEGISQEYLTWRGIEATLNLAKSNNAKVVVIGGSENGLPLILNTESNTSLSLTSSPPSNNNSSEQPESSKEENSRPSSQKSPSMASQGDPQLQQPDQVDYDPNLTN